MTSTTLTKIDTFIGNLRDVSYNAADDKIYWASHTSIGRYGFDGNNKETLIQGPTTLPSGRSCDSKFASSNETNSICKN